jgi:DNA-binding NarL/FixJ family response regulator
MRIAIVDDHRLFRELLRALASRHTDLQIVGEAGTARDAPAAVDAAAPDVVLLDFLLPDSSGPTVIRELLRREPQRKILMLSMCVDDEHVSTAFDAGALGYATKDQSWPDLADAMRRVARGERYLAPSLSPGLLDARNGRRKDEPLGALTSRERDVFHLAVRALSNEAVARQLGISRRTVETHRARILRKLRARSATDLVRYAARHALLQD